MIEINDCINYDETEESCVKLCDKKHCMLYEIKDDIDNKLKELE